MSEKIKNYLGIAISIAVLAVGYAVVSYVQTYARSSEPTSYRSFSVSGDGKAVAIPDVAAFTFSVVTEGGKNLGDLQGQNANNVNKAIAYIKSKNIEGKDIQTKGYDVSPRYQSYNCSPYPYPLMENSSGASSGGSAGIAVPMPTRPCPPAQIIGYTVTQTVQVKIRDFSKIGDILGGVVQNGANSVSQLTFTIDDPTKPQSEARDQAIAKAKTKAEAIAKAGGFRIGRLLSVDEGGGYPVYYAAKSEALGMGGGASAPPSPTIEPGSQEVNVTVTLRYEIR